MNRVRTSNRFARRLRQRTLCVLGVLLVSLVALSPKASAQNPDVTVFAPGYYTTAELDETVRYSWSPDNGQDFFRIVFNRYRSFGWESTTYNTPETVLTSKYLAPRDVGLTPGTWYWRLCYGWNEDRNHTCYLDDDVRQLEVVEPAPPPQVLTASEARRVSRRALRRRYGKSPRVLRCRRYSLAKVACRGYFSNRTSRRVLIRETATQYILYFTR